MRNNYISFDVENRLAFELPLREVSNVTKPSKTEVSVEMHPPKYVGGKGAGKEDTVLEIKFYLPGNVAADNDDATSEIKVEADGSGEEDSKSALDRSTPLLDEDGDEMTAASLFYESVKEFADVGVVSGESLCSFGDLLCLTPRGRFTLDFYESCLRLRGKSHDYKVNYESISHFFSLPKLDEIHQYLVLGLDPPLRQGQTRYPFLVFQLAHDFEVEVELNCDAEKLPTLFGGRLKPEYDSPIHAVLEELLAVVTGKPAVFACSTYQSAQGLKGIKCSVKTNEATLYPLDKAFLVVPKPPTLIMHGDITNVIVSRVAGGVASISRTFEMTFNMRSGSDYTFNNINREEYASLAKFMLSKNIRVKSELDGSGATRIAELGSSEDEISAASDESDSKVQKQAPKRKRPDAGLDAEDDLDESEDEDFVAESSDESSVAEEYSENVSSSDSDSEEDSKSSDASSPVRSTSPKKKVKTSPKQSKLSAEYVDSD